MVLFHCATDSSEIVLPGQKLKGRKKPRSRVGEDKSSFRVPCVALKSNREKNNTLKMTLRLMGYEIMICMT